MITTGKHWLLFTSRFAQDILLDMPVKQVHQDLMTSLLSSHCTQNSCSLQTPNSSSSRHAPAEARLSAQRMHSYRFICIACSGTVVLCVCVLEFYSNLKILNFKVSLFSNYRKLQHVLLKPICSKVSFQLSKQGGCGSAKNDRVAAVTVYRKLGSSSNKSSGHQFLATDFKAVVIFKAIYLSLQQRPWVLYT